MTSGDDPGAPHPPRHWWLKRLTLGAVALAAALAAVRAGWGWEAGRRLGRAYAEIEARGEPVRPDDVATAQVPEAENAAAYLLRAAAAVDPDADCPSSSGVAFGGFPPFPPRWVQMADASVAASPKAFELARRARKFDRATWPPAAPPAAGPRLLASPANSLPGIHHLANTVSDAALDMHVHGDEVAALQAIRDTRHLARAVGAYPGVAGCMVARNHESIAVYKLQIIATGLRVAPRDAPTAGDFSAATALPVPNPPVRPAARDDVRALVDELLDERHWDSDLAPALAADRALLVEAGEWASRSTRLLRPMVMLDLARALAVYRPGAEAAAEPTWHAARAVLARHGRLPPPAPSVHYYAALPPVGNARRRPIDFAGLISRSDLMLRVDRVIEQDARVRAERRAAAVSLAAQLYRADHGRWPADLAALVPAYLPAVPADPFSPGGAPLRYLLARNALPDGRDRPVVYTVNLDGKDDTPDASALASGPQFGWRRSRDVHFDLSPWAPQVVPATTTPSPDEPD